MQQEYGMTPVVEHYDCLIDILGRAGQLEELDALFNRMPCLPTIVSWTTLLGACRNQRDVVRGRLAAKHMFELDSKDASPLVTLANIYVMAGLGNGAER